MIFKEYNFERGTLSSLGFNPDEVLKVKVGKVTYVYDENGDKVGWIPAKEDIAKELLAGNYSGTLANDNKIVVSYAQSDLVAANQIDDALCDLMGVTTGRISSNPCKEIPLPTTKVCWLSEPDSLPKTGNGKTQTFYAPGNGVPFTKPQTMLQNLIETNKQAAKQAAYLEAGRLANETLANIMAKKFPQLPQTPFNALVMANIADQVAKNFKPNPQLAKLTAAMTTQAFLELYGMIDLDGVIAEFINGTDGIALGEYVE